ncbi:ABC transporter ATP-binding protein [Paenibacillus sp. FSL R7-0204]|uniref:ABC transporter ATP-binding protein n=1 Tax=Paenibacillus sp. FSL R7-0204 TaxID=2921675 RepID=UPI0030FB3C2E
MIVEQPILAIQNLDKNYESEAGMISILKEINLKFYKKEIVSIMGPSGSGKSTLLGIMGTLDEPSKGKVALEGKSVEALSEGQLSDYRAQKIGFIFQSFNLISTMTALENVMLPMFCIKGIRHSEIRRKAEEMLRLVGMGNRMKHLPNQLSGGQQQRVAIARALINRPSLVIADEPTGNLDRDSGQKVLELIFRLKEQLSMTFIIATHDPEVAAKSDRVIHIRDGRVESDNTQLSRGR